MNLLNDLKDHQGHAEKERMDHASELLSVREKLLQSKQIEESARNER